jgi:hypothetical protein
MNGRAGISPDDIERAILERLAVQPPGRSIAPTDVARALGGDHPDGWAPLMQPVRRAAVRLMKAGRVLILRKGRPVDPEDFRGIYRIALPPEPQVGSGKISGT